MRRGCTTPGYSLTCWEGGGSQLDHFKPFVAKLGGGWLGKSVGSEEMTEVVGQLGPFPAGVEGGVLQTAAPQRHGPTCVSISKMAFQLSMS